MQEFPVFEEFSGVRLQTKSTALPGTSFSDGRPATIECARNDRKGCTEFNGIFSRDSNADRLHPNIRLRADVKRETTRRTKRGPISRIAKVADAHTDRRPV